MADYPPDTPEGPQDAGDGVPGAARTGVAAARRAAAFVPTTTGALAPAWANPDGAPPAQLMRDLDRRAR